MSPKGVILPATIPEVTCELPPQGTKTTESLSPFRPVYEYPLNGQWIMLDMDDGYVLWTGIWKGERFFFLGAPGECFPEIAFLLFFLALGNSKGSLLTSLDMRLKECY